MKSIENARTTLSSFMYNIFELDLNDIASSHKFDCSISTYIYPIPPFYVCIFIFIIYIEKKKKKKVISFTHEWITWSGTIGRGSQHVIHAVGVQHERRIGNVKFPGSL